MSEITIVTAFFDIGREKWLGFERDNNKYIEYFKFWARIKNKIVIYTDSETAKKVLKIRDEFNLSDRTQVVTIDDISSLDSEIYKKIKKAFEKKDLVNYRKYPNNPESYNPDYNYLTYLKPYFVADAVKRGYVEGLVSWVDFGYNHGGEVYINSDEFSFLWEYDFAHKIHVFLLKKISDMPIFRIIKEMPIDMTAGIIIAPAQLWIRLSELFRESMLHLTHCGLVDDDQTLLIMSYQECPELFELHYMENWFMPWKKYGAGHLSVCDKMKYKLIKSQGKNQWNKGNYKESIISYYKYVVKKIQFNLKKK